MPIDNLHKIQTLSELRHARERVAWHLDTSRRDIRRDYDRIVGMLTVANIARLAVGHLENLREVIGLVREGWNGVRGIFKKTENGSLSDLHSQVGAPHKKEVSRKKKSE